VTYDRKKLEAELVRDEGERLRAYRCTAGKLTIGIGRNLDDVGLSAAEVSAMGLTMGTARAAILAKGITREQSRQLFANDLARIEHNLDHNLPWWRTLSDVRQRVLLNMCFNLGIKGLLGFRNTLAQVQAGQYAGAARGMKASLWHRQVGNRAIRLEAMMETGKVA
jgi:lysozyme